MPKELISLSKSSLAFAKLSATPTDKAWSQAYNAGNLFACLSLNSQDGEELHALQTLGKDLFSNLETEFFTLEEKNLTTITEAIQKSTKHIPETISVDFCLAYFKESALYLFILGSGRVVMKRGEKMGILLEKTDADKTLLTASGYLQNGDIVILETSKFAENVSDKDLTEGLQLNLPSDIAESLSLHMHEKPDGDQAAIIVVYHGVAKAAPEESEEKEEEITLADVQADDQPLQPEVSDLPHLPSLPPLPRIPKLPNFILTLNHRKRFFLSIVVLIFVILVASIFLTKQKQENSKNSELFNSIYAVALKNYDEGMGLKSLNDNLSREDLQKAEKTLLDGRDIFPEGSKEDQQIEELLKKVQAELGGSSGDQTATTEVELDENSLLGVAKSNSDGTGFNQNEGLVFFATSKAIFSIEKSSGDKEELIANDEDWEKALSVVPYQANIYVLDPENGVLKFVPSNDDYTKNNYFTDPPDLNKATSMAIDSAIWILFSDGSINKFLKGEKQSFSVKGLDKPMKNPTKLFTDSDTESLYVLDKSNSRIVQIGKDGAFQKQYNAGILKDARDFEVLEKDKKINILSGDKTYQLNME